MTRFHYQAIDATGAPQQGIIEAADEAGAVARLRQDGHLPVRIHADTGEAEPIAARGGMPRLRPGEVAEATRELAIMLGAGQDLDRALRYLIETAPNRRIRGSMTALREIVRDGGSLAGALARQPGNFPPLYLGMVQAGEAGGRLAEALAGLSDSLERAQALAATVRSALVYPALLVIAAVVTIVLILTQVLPQFTPLFAEAGAALPGSTRMLIAAGDLVADDGAFLLLGMLALWLLAQLALQSGPMRLLADRMLLRLPVTGGMLREILAARLTRTLGTLLANGVPLIAALRIVRGVLQNSAAVAAVARASTSAEGGADLAGPLEASRVFPVRTVQLLRLGEENAQLGPMSLRAAAIHEERVRLAVQRLLALLVPGITIVMGGIVAAIVASLLTAMLSLNDLAQ